MASSEHSVEFAESISPCEIMSARFSPSTRSKERTTQSCFSKYDDPVIFNYNPSKFGATVAMDIMRTHPLVIIGGLLRENTFFILPEQFLDEMPERREVYDRSIVATQYGH